MEKTLEDCGHKIIGTDVWHGYRRTRFDFDGYIGWVVEPKCPAPGSPWTWTMQWADAFVERTGVPALLHRGFHHVTLEAHAVRAADEVLPVFKAFQEFLVGKLGFAPKAKLIGMSWGGFYSIRYAATYPELIERIYLDAPLLTLEAFPHDIGPWENHRPKDGWDNDPRMPVNMAAIIAQAGIPIVHVYGGADNLVIPRLNSETFIERFKAAGGKIDVISRPPYGHHPHGFDDVSPIVEFMTGKPMADIPDYIFFDPTFGYSPEDLLKVEAPPPPADFDDFWKGLYAKATAHVPTYKVEKEVWSPDPKVKISQIRFTNYDGVEIGMWIARPEKSTGGLLIGQGYGNPATPPTASNPGLTVCLPCIRGLGLSQCAEIPWEPGAHAGYGIKSRDTYVIGGAITDLWAAASVMIDMFPDVADNLNYSGGSLGGGMGVLMLPWDRRFRAGEINVPTLAGPMQFAFDVKGDGPGSTRRSKALSDPDCMKALSYYDGVAAAKRLRIPVLITPALSDHSNPPPAQFAIANAIPEEWRTMRIREVGHRAPTAKDTELNKELDALREKLFMSAGN